MKISRFEDIQAWQEARELVKLVYEAINVNERFQRDYRLMNQIQAAAVSVMSNIAEGFTRRGDRSSCSSFTYQKVLPQRYRVNCMLLWTRSLLTRKHSKVYMHRPKKLLEWFQILSNI